MDRAPSPPARRPVPRRVSLALAAAALAGLAACAQPPGPAAELPAEATVADPVSGRVLDAGALTERARAADLVVVGEVHDDPVHQQVQAALARALDVRALALEMVPRTAEPALAELRAAQAPDDAMRAAAAWDDYAPWQGVIEAVPRAEVAGGGVAREDLRAAMTGGVAAAFGPEAPRYGLDAPLPEAEQAALEAELDASHCGALPGEMLAPMVEAQRLRDARFAEALLRARARAGGAQAMLVTGNGHARRDRGVPWVLADAAPELSVLSILQAEWAADAPGDVAAALAPWRRADGTLPYDLAVISPAPEREDPCARFRNQG
ncbi:ChaN family lipoprotein [Albimonas sp. CAU 1670]|uniref:ChaN family lipoprotein n=1 Tax=Albimonas sp. CAU 1670 TaxID=3032599 RepID=UPI0023D9963F|nr:ChaN family lipoprotein [Albimonas sp. CAU 1670]MDF2232798.1 ChaN family lipoprotein [Albimonas sp. CAU 1670]